MEILDCIDMILAPDRDGKVCLVITDAGMTTDPDKRNALFREKVRNYFGAVVDGHFKKEYPKLKTPDFHIKVISTTPPTPEMYELHSIQSRSRPEHHMEVRFVQFNDRPWPGQKFDVAGAKAKIPPASPALKKMAEDALAFAFDTLRDGCFYPTTVSAGENGEGEMSALVFEGEQILLAAQSLAAKAPPEIRRFVCVYDAWISAPGQERHDALMARCSERGRAKGLVIAQKYRPASGRKKASTVGEPEIVGECENDLEPPR